jgi:hypothetical protein
MPYNPRVFSFIETKLFTRLVQECLTDDEYQDYPKIEQGVIWMVTMYAKNVADNIPAHVLRELRKEVENG